MPSSTDTKPPGAGGKMKLRKLSADNRSSPAWDTSRVLELTAGGLWPSGKAGRQEGAQCGGSGVAEQAPGSPGTRPRTVSEWRGEDGCRREEAAPCQGRRRHPGAMGGDSVTADTSPGCLPSAGGRQEGLCVCGWTQRGPNRWGHGGQREEVQDCCASPIPHPTSSQAGEGASLQTEASASPAYQRGPVPGC